MPRAKKRTTRRRGGSIKQWALRAHNKMRSINGYSRGLSHAYNRFGKSQVSKLGKHAGLVNKGVEIALAKLKQSGYGLRRSGNGLTRSGNGLTRAGGRLKY
jgi:hypothetical protein